MQRSVAERSVAECSGVQRSAAECSGVQRSAAECSWRAAECSGGQLEGSGVQLEGSVLMGRRWPNQFRLCARESEALGGSEAQSSHH